MNDTPDFLIDDPQYSICRLQPEHSQALQKLFEACADFAMLVEGEAVSPTAAQDFFQSMPSGWSFKDKFLYGLLDQQGEMVAVLESIRHYPQEATWWIGLLMLAPRVRGQGLGQKIVEGFVEHAAKEGSQSIMLGVVEENLAAYRFWQKVGFELVRTTEPRQFGRKTQKVYVMRSDLPQEHLFDRPQT
jgi:RimJ/RimL family protein N-acetyltransferase